jgi:Ca2+-binding RTX toxin-like protein
MANPFFNAAYYLAQNPDVAAAGYTLSTAEQHYDQHGAAELRAPNPWFDARAYLAAYPDLVANGVTAATAFSHYINYGIAEGRSPAANLNPATFSYAGYAAANPDLQAIFGITDPAHLTPGQEHALLAHFLSYGYVEGRPGIATTDGNSFFAPYASTPPVLGGGMPPPPPPPPPVDQGTIVDGTHASKIYIGTTGADTFTGTQVHLEGTTLQGLAGGDALTAASLTGSLNITLDSVETIQASLAGDTSLTVIDTTVIAGPELGLNTIALTSNSHAFTYGRAPVAAFALNDNANLTYHTGPLAGTNDILALSLAGGTTSSVRVDGGGGAIEHYNVTYGGAGNLTLDARDVNGGTLTVDLLGANNAGNADSLTLKGSTGAIQNVIVDGSAGTGNQTIAIDPSFSAASATVTGGSGNDTLNVSLAGNASDLTLAGIETLHVALSASNAGSLVVHGSDVGTLDVDGQGFGLSYTGEKVGTIILESGGALSYTLASELAGTTDALAVVIAADTSSSLTVRPQILNGVDTYNLAFNGNGAFVLDDHGVNASTLTVNVASVAGANTVLGVAVNSGGLGVLPSGLTTVKADGSAGAGNQTITLGAELAGIDAQVNGGSGNDVLSGVAAAGHASTLSGGAGNDTLNASAGQDSLTGGLGADKFQFAAGTATYTPGATTTATVDSVADLQAGDTLTLAGSAHIQANWSLLGLLSNQNGVVSTSGAPQDLAIIVSFIQGNSQPNAAYLFQLGADAYFLNTGDLTRTTSQLVKLANTSVADLQFTNGGTGVQHILPPFVIDHVGTYTGTGGDDVFQFNGDISGLDGVVVDGLASNDTLALSVSGMGTASMTLNNVENLNVTAPNASAQLIVAGSGLHSITVGGGGSEIFSYSGVNVDTVHLVSSADTIVIGPTNTPGANDGLAVQVDDNVTSRVNVNGIEHVSLALGANTNIAFTFGGGNQNTVASLTVTGGATNSTLVVAAPTGSTPSLTSAVVDAAAVTGNQIISFDPTQGGDFNATVTGGVGNDTLSTVTDATHTATLIGGAGADTLNASAGKDTMTGGLGADTFQFAAGTAAAIGSPTATTVDTITDIQVGDTLTLAGSAHIQADWSTAGQLSNHNGIIVVDVGGPQTLSAIAAAAAASSQSNAAYLFQFGADSYFLNTGDGGANVPQWVKLANTLVSDLHLTNGGAGVARNSPPVTITGPLGSYSGTAGDDVFTGEFSNVTGSTIQALAGNDTLNVNYSSAGGTSVNLDSVEKIAVALNAISGQLTVAGSGVQSVSLTSALYSNTFAYAGAKVDAFALLGDSTAIANFNAGVSGSADALSLTTAASVATTTNVFTANGIEHYDIALTGQSDSFDLGANAVDGGTLSVVLTGGGSGAIGAVLLHSANSVGLNTVTVDASTFVGGFQFIDLDSTMASANVTVTGSAGDDQFGTATDAAHNYTVNGGQGNDWMYASLGIDKMTGGDGNDVFYFRFHIDDGKSRVDSGVVVTDEIVDFTFGDQVQFGFPSTHIDSTRTLAGIGAGTNNGTFVFQTAPTTLAQAQTALDGLGANVNVVFKLADGNAYYLNTVGAGMTDDTIVKLTGVNIANLTVDDAGVHYTGAPV